MKAGRTAPSPGPCLPVLVLAGLLADALGQEVDFQPEWGFDSYEITTPKKLGLRTQGPRVARQESYLLKVKGKNRVLQLRPKRFLLPRHLRVFSFTEQGELTEDHPYLPPGCNYAGAVEEAPESEAIFSTCMGGLRGILKIEEDLYQVEPLKDSSTFEHVVYLLNKEYLSNWTCGLTDDDIERQMPQYEHMARGRDFAGSYKHPKYMELVMLFDHGRYLFVNSNLTQALSDALLLTGIMDTYFREISMRIHLKALEIWTDKDKINIEVSKLTEVLSQFLLYRRNILNARILSDWSHLYVKREFPDALGWAFIGLMCTALYGGSTSIFPNLDILGPGTLSTHELGHGLGMKHDEEYCQCKGKHSCIMGTGHTGWSNCSFIYYFKFVNSGGSCLNNMPEITYMLDSCGNKIVEENEECDCGSRAECQKDKCCQPDCTLKRGAKCSIGLCCHNCQFRSLGDVCRERVNECDLEEYCSGTSSLCPDDLYKQDGTPCRYNSLCFQKVCNSRFLQCQRIFGPSAKNAPNQCYYIVNVAGDQYGNCGIIGPKSYKKCTSKNFLCGRLQCININTLPQMPDHTLIINTHLRKENITCWGTGYHFSMKLMEIPDLGVINDGTPCGWNQICINRTCVNISVLEYDCFPGKCNQRGTCNNRKNCHCMYGWSPPFCDVRGYGGSIDSGHAKPLRLEVFASTRILSIMLLRFIFLIFSVIIVLLSKFI